MSNAKADSDAHLSPRGPSRKLMAVERHAQILRALRVSGSIQVPTMAASIGVSEMTVRRDLVELEQESRLIRIHGGAVALNDPPPILMDNDEPSFEARLARQSAAKEAISATAVELLAGCRTIALDVGTTSFFLAQRLTELAHIKVFTNNLRIASLLCDTSVEVYLAGGRVRRDERAITGPSAVAQFEPLWFDASVIGVAGVTEDGFYDYALEELDMKRVFLRRSGMKIVLCDATKFRRMSLVHIAPLAEATMVITDAEPPAEIRAAFTRANVELHIAGKPSWSKRADGG